MTSPTTLAAAVAAANPGDEIRVLAGTYTGSVVTLSDADLTVSAVGAVTISGGGFYVNAANVTIQGFDFSGIAVGQSPGYNNASIAVAGSGFEALNNTFVNTEAAIMTTTGLASGSRSTRIVGNRFLTGVATGSGMRNRLYINPTPAVVEVERNVFFYGPSSDNDTTFRDNVFGYGVNLGLAPEAHGMVIEGNDFIPTGVGQRVATRYTLGGAPWNGVTYTVVAENNWWGSDAGPGNVQQPDGSGAFLYADDGGGSAPFILTGGGFSVSPYSTSRNSPVAGAPRAAISGSTTVVPDLPATINVTLSLGDLSYFSLAGYTLASLPAGLTVTLHDATAPAAVLATTTTNGSGAASFSFVPTGGVGLKRYFVRWDSSSDGVLDVFGTVYSAIHELTVGFPNERWAAPAAVGLGDGSSPANASTLEAAITAAAAGEVVNLLPGDYGTEGVTIYSVPVAKTGLTLRGRGAARILGQIQVYAPAVMLDSLVFAGSAVYPGETLPVRVYLASAAGAAKVVNCSFPETAAPTRAILTAYGAPDSPLGDMEFYGNDYGPNAQIFVNLVGDKVKLRRSVFRNSTAFDDDVDTFDSIVLPTATLDYNPNAPVSIARVDLLGDNTTAGIRRYQFPGDVLNLSSIYWGAASGPSNLPGGTGRWADEFNDAGGDWIDDSLGITGSEAFWVDLGSFAVAANKPAVGPFLLDVADGIGFTSNPVNLTAALGWGSVKLNDVEMAGSLPAGQVVQFFVNGSSVGTAPTSDAGVATLAWTPVAPGSYTVTARYAGDILDGIAPVYSDLGTITVENIQYVNVVARTGDAIFGLPGVTLGKFSGTSVNANGDFSFVATLQGAGVTSTNDQAALVSTGGVVELVAREGTAIDSAFTFGSFNGTTFSNVGRVALAGGTTSGRGWSGYETNSGLDVVTVQTRAISPISSVGVGSVFPVALDDDGRAMIRAGLISDGVSVTADNDSFVAALDTAGDVDWVLLEGDFAPVSWGLAPGAEVGQILSSPTVARRSSAPNPPYFAAAVRIVSPDEFDPLAVVVAGRNPGAMDIRAGEGDFIPTAAGIDSGLKYSTFGDVQVNSQRDVLIQGKVFGATLATDDVLVVTQATGERYLVVREGDPTGILGVTFRAISGPVLNSDRRVYFQAVLAGTGVTTANQLSLWRFRLNGGVGQLQLVARTGSVAPGTGGATYTGFSGLAVGPVNHAVFAATLSGSASTNAALFFSQGGDTITVTPRLRKGDVVGGKTVSAITLVSGGDTSGRGRSYVENGALRRAVVRLGFTDTTEAIALVTQNPIIP